MVVFPNVLSELKVGFVLREHNMGALDNGGKFLGLIDDRNTAK